jgi:hypothetical protein
MLYKVFEIAWKIVSFPVYAIFDTIEKAVDAHMHKTRSARLYNLYFISTMATSEILLFPSTVKKMIKHLMTGELTSRF